jgi:hypothetical protein
MTVAFAALIDAAFEIAQVNSPTLMDLRESMRVELKSIVCDLEIDALPGDRNDE